LVSSSSGIAVNTKVSADAAAAVKQKKLESINFRIICIAI
jgi:hypothetical protein